MMTSVMPSATQALIEDCRGDAEQVARGQKLGLSRAKTVAMAARPSSAGVAQAEAEAEPALGHGGAEGGVGAGHGSGSRSVGRGCGRRRRLRHGEADDGFLAQLSVLEHAGGDPPSRMTRTRSATRRISGSSEETTIIARLGREPLDQGVDLGLGADVDAGGLVEQEEAPAAIQRPMIAFCWLPPENWPIGLPLSIASGRRLRLRIRSMLASVSARRRTKPRRAKRRRQARSILLRTERRFHDGAVALAPGQEAGKVGGDRRAGCRA
ncbi:MAG: hypothetical protein U1E17_04355 [Geminicoccaceae bacterium]